MTTLRAGLIGEHISRTRLPAALKIMCDAAGWELDFTLIDTADDPEFDFDGMVDTLRSEGWSGVTVTHPWKRHARAYVDDGMVTGMDHLGAANTLVFGDGVQGYNTDFSGFLGAFRAARFTPGRVVMIGAGGVAEALGAALVSLGAKDLTIADLDPTRAADLASGLGPPAHAIPISQIKDAVRAADGLVNATPLGMAEYPGSAFEPDWLGGQAWAFDAVYTPTDTAFLQAADKAGLATLTGFELFRHMAIGSFAAYTGVTLDPDDILPELEGLKP